MGDDKLVTKYDLELVKSELRRSIRKLGWKIEALRTEIKLSEIRSSIELIKYKTTVATVAIVAIFATSIMVVLGFLN